MIGLPGDPTMASICHPGDPPGTPFPKFKSFRFLATIKLSFPDVQLHI
jgi:hypothetical protein